MGNEQQGSNMNLQIQGYSRPQIRVRVWIVLREPSVLRLQELVWWPRN